MYIQSNNYIMFKEKIHHNPHQQPTHPLHFFQDFFKKQYQIRKLYQDFTSNNIIEKNTNYHN